VGVFKFAKIQMKSKKNEKHVGTLNIIMPPKNLHVLFTERKLFQR
jgi:hypothetical protein